MICCKSKVLMVFRLKQLKQLEFNAGMILANAWSTYLKKNAKLLMICHLILKELRWAFKLQKDVFYVAMNVLLLYTMLILYFNGIKANNACFPPTSLA